MDEHEIETFDLKSIYKLIEVHSDMNDNKSKKKGQPIDQTEVYIDGIVF